VVCLIGDGGLQFTLPELASAVEAQVPLIVLLWNNQGYEEIKKYMVNRAIEPVGVDIHTPTSSAWRGRWGPRPRTWVMSRSCRRRWAGGGASRADIDPGGSGAVAGCCGGLSRRDPSRGKPAPTNP
jgi:hypothetical protein